MKESASRLASAGIRLSDWFERWFPDAFALGLSSSALQFVIHAPLVLLMVWALNYTLAYAPLIRP